MSTESESLSTLALSPNVHNSSQRAAAVTTSLLAFRVHDDDDVAVALRALHAGERVTIGSISVVATETIGAGHKIALHAMQPDEIVHKYGVPIGRVTSPIAAGAWVHSHNLATRLTGDAGYVRHAHQANATTAFTAVMPTFDGYRRADGRIATRNEIWVLNTVGCVNTAAERIARAATERFAGTVDGIHAFAHPYGCSQLGDDLKPTQAVLGGLLCNPNAGGALVLWLGCENNQLPAFLRDAAPSDASRLRSFNTQDVQDEIEAGVVAIGELIDRMASDKREPVPRIVARVGSQVRRLGRIQRTLREPVAWSLGLSRDCVRWHRRSH